LGLLLATPFFEKRHVFFVILLFRLFSMFWYLKNYAGGRLGVRQFWLYPGAIGLISGFPQAFGGNLR